MTQADQDRRIDYIEFQTTDIEASKRFYGDVFGWKLIDYGPEYFSFMDGRTTGGFAKVSEVITGGPLVVLYAKDLGDTLERVKAGGGTIVREIFEFPGGRRFHFTDPSGNELAVWSE